MKKAVLHTTTLMHCKARKVLRDLFSTNQRNGSEIRFVAGATKINPKNLKTWLCLDDLMQANNLKHQLYFQIHFHFWQILTEVLLELIS